MKQTDISILITNYNHSKFITECLDAVFAQSAQAKEVIVIDDASTDGSLSAIGEYRKKQPSVILLRNSTNLGPAKTMNKAIQAATGKYIVLAAADDQVLPGFFEKASAALDQYPEAGICCSTPSMFYDAKPYRYWQTPISYKKNSFFIPPDRIGSYYRHTPLWIPTHASLYRRDLVIQYGALDEELKHICDWYLNCRIALTHGILFIPETFGAFRVSPQSYGATWNRSYRKKIPVYNRLFKKIEQEPKEFQKAFRNSGVLGLITADVLAYLLLRVRFWKYFPSSFYRKALNLLRKISPKKLLAP